MRGLIKDRASDDQPNSHFQIMSECGCRKSEKECFGLFRCDQRDAAEGDKKQTEKQDDSKCERVEDRVHIALMVELRAAMAAFRSSLYRVWISAGALTYVRATDTRATDMRATDTCPDLSLILLILFRVKFLKRVRKLLEFHFAFIWAEEFFVAFEEP
jgi:hypothetical protein